MLFLKQIRKHCVLFLALRHQSLLTRIRDWFWSIIAGICKWRGHEVRDEKNQGGSRWSRCGACTQGTLEWLGECSPLDANHVHLAGNEPFDMVGHNPDTNLCTFPYSSYYIIRNFANTTSPCDSFLRGISNYGLRSTHDIITLFVIFT